MRRLVELLAEWQELSWEGLAMTRARSLFAAFLVAGALISTAAAYWITAREVVLLPGADPAGNPDDLLGTTVTGKVFKDSNTGIITLLATGFVTNESGRKVWFDDLGTPVTDPETGTEYTATSSSEVICRPWCFCRCSRCSTTVRATLVATYDPSLDEEYEEEESDESSDGALG
jgi:hypothetical protein